MRDRNFLDRAGYPGVDPVPHTDIGPQEPCHLCEKYGPTPTTHPEFAVDGEYVCERHYNNWRRNDMSIKASCDVCGEVADSLEGLDGLTRWLTGHFQLQQDELADRLNQGEGFFNCIHRPQEVCEWIDIDIEISDTDQSGWVSVDFDKIEGVRLVNGE